jgi:L-Ala-D/L-Glu epimerase / N-acetyl-D-glutamate racemase
MDEAADCSPEGEMNRRDLLKLSATAAAALPFANSMEAMADATTGVRAKFETQVVRLNLQHMWTTTMSSSAYRDTLHVRYTRDGVTGYGEGAPIVRYQEDAVSGQKALQGIQELIESANPWEFDKLMAEVSKRLPHERAARSALDIALMDWIGKKLNVPIYRYLGLDPKDAPVTTFSIGIDTPEITKQKTREAEQYPVLKVKVGLATDEPTIEAVRSVTKKPLRVDANEGWKDKDEAVRKINWLETQGVEFIEQPLPAAMPLEDIQYIRKRVHMPIIADESCTDAAAIPKLATAYDGINVKLDKAGGIMESYRWIKMARALNMKVMLGCMISSSCTCTAAAHLSPLVDYADIDGPLLIANDPFVGVQLKQGQIVLPDGPGLGIRTRV